MVTGENAGLSVCLVSRSRRMLPVGRRICCSSPVGSKGLKLVSEAQKQSSVQLQIPGA